MPIWPVWSLADGLAHTKIQAGILGHFLGAGKLIAALCAVIMARIHRKDDASSDLWSLFRLLQGGHQTDDFDELMHAVGTGKQEADPWSLLNSLSRYKKCRTDTEEFAKFAGQSRADFALSGQDRRKVALRHDSVQVTLVQATRFNQEAQ